MPRAWASGSALAGDKTSRYAHPSAQEEKEVSDAARCAAALPVVELRVALRFRWSQSDAADQAWKSPLPLRK